MPRSAKFIHNWPKSCTLLIAVGIMLLWALPACAQTAASATAPASFFDSENWNLHLQNTDTVQGYPAFHAKYSGANSLPSGGQIRETIAVDILAGLRLWSGAELHFDGLMWQGFGLHDSLGVDDFPNAEAYKSGTAYPRLNLAQIFLRQTIGLGSEEEVEPDDPVHIPGKRDVTRLVITVGRFSVINMFDQNSYAGDPTIQFLNWSLVTNAAWDYAAGSLGFTTGLSLGLHLPHWAFRYGFFQLTNERNAWTAEDALFIKPGYQNIVAGDGKFWLAWGMVGELDRYYTVKKRPGAIRLLAYINRAHMGSYTAALSVPGHDLTETYRYRINYGFGINWEQAVSDDLGLFSRLGWNRGSNEAWMFTDINYTASLGLSLKGQRWNRDDDTVGLAGVISGISRPNQRYLNAGGLGILDGDGALSYGWEQVLETYYDCLVWGPVHLAFDYQLVVNPAFNRDRGPVNILGARLHFFI
jgi:high affinity Mn2+ porin